MRYAVTAGAVIVFFLLGANHASAQDDINQVIRDTGSIFTYVLDTGTASSARLSPNTIADKLGWTLLEEGDIAHNFAGDTVLLNDRIAVVVRRGAPGAEVYVFGENGPVYRATLAPAPLSDNETTTLQRVAIAENTTGATEINATYGTRRGTPISVAYRLATGQIQVQMKPGDGVDTIRVEGQTDFLVVPDFFADDIVYNARQIDTKSAALPTENFYLHLSGGGTSIITCVWQSTERTTRAVFDGDGENRVILRSEIECAAGKLVWVAFAEHTDLWYTRSIIGDDQKADVPLDWRPPFPAKWRGSLVVESEVAQSWNFADTRTANYNAPGLGEIVYPCWFSDGTPFVHAPPSKMTSPLRVVIYPIDRTQATPLNEYLLVDVMRSTLGVGPCQYILDIEGLDAQTSPTPALVCEYVEGQLKKKKSRQEPATMRERIDAMVSHVEHAESRVAAYAALGKTIRVIDVGATASGNPEVREIARILDDMDAAIVQLAPARRSPKEAKMLADQLAGLADTENWKESFEHVDYELRAIGSAQDRTLAKCRMDLRRLKQYCLSVKEKAPGSAPLANAIVTRIDEAFQPKE